MEPVSREQKSSQNRLLGRGLAIFIVLYIAATVYFIVLV